MRRIEGRIFTFAAQPLMSSTYGKDLPLWGTPIEYLIVRRCYGKKMDRIKVLNLSPEDLLWARLAESAFSFWDNPEDAIYDEL